MKDILVISEHLEFFDALFKALKGEYLPYFIALTPIHAKQIAGLGYQSIDISEYLAENSLQENETYINDSRVAQQLLFDRRILELRGYGDREADLVKLFFCYQQAFAEIFKRFRIDGLATWNKAYAVARAAHESARQQGIPTIVLERGLFRPYTITMDPKGVNYENSVPREADFYRKLDQDELEERKRLFNGFIKLLEKKHEFIPKQDPPSASGIPIFMKNLTMLAKKRAYFYLHRKKRLDLVYFLQVQTTGNYIKTKARSIASRRLKIKRKTESQPQGLSKPYIFIPFQVHDDTQMLCFSPNISNMGELVRRVKEGFLGYKALITRSKAKTSDLSLLDARLVFKEHPADKGRIDYRELRYIYQDDPLVNIISTGDTQRLIREAQLVITINSTVGLEALQAGKKVITLGQAFFNIDGIVHHCPEPSHLPRIIHEAIQTPIDRDLRVNFLDYLKFIYQVPGSFIAPDEQTLSLVAERFKEMMGENRHEA